MSSGGRVAVDDAAVVAEAAAAHAAMRRLWRLDERDCLPPLIAAAALSAAQRARIAPLAHALIEGARRAEHRVAPALVRQLALDSPVGLALLPLAEALLRVPDAANADRLIRDHLAGIQWRTSGASGPVALALRLAAAWASKPQRFPSVLLRTSMQAMMRRLGGQFIFGATIETALARVARSSGAAAAHYRYSFDMLGEAALTAEDAQHYLAAYEHAIHAVGAANRGTGPLAGAGVSVKLSALHPRFGYMQRQRMMQELAPRLRALALLAQRYQIAFTIDAEEADRLEPSLDMIGMLMTDAALADWAGLGVAVQAYQKRAPAVIEHLLNLAARRRHKLMVRLVKGAYWDMEIKLAQVEGQAGYPVYTRKLYTDVAYLACARRLLTARTHVLPQFATHNGQTVAEILELASDTTDEFEFQCLYGMGAALYREVLRRPEATMPVRIYAPVGAHAALLPYLMRRLLENGATSSFVHRAARTPLARLCADPVEAAARLAGTPHPQIALPRALFMPERLNSAGLDLADDAERASLMQALEHSRGVPVEVRPMIAAAIASSASAREIRNPANGDELIGTVFDADDGAVDCALEAAVTGARVWAGTAIATRAHLLERAAELFEQNTAALVALTVREAGKTLANAVGEVREAVDYLRYYAARIRAEFDPALHLPLGPVVCISPWNFPLAIFTGQIAAALAAGNAVLAKPAEQSTASAALALRLLREAGIPASALQFVPGDGELVGTRLVADARVRGVVFTGSIEAARSIARALAVRGEVAFIAETGGQNAMIVDSTALPEQVVADVLRSAFDSTGQRCSSLRVLCLQNEIAAPVLKMLEGAMRELRVGDPGQIATDVGPLIDAEARERIQAYLQAMHARVRCRSPLSAECARGMFIAPTLVELESIGELRSEVFGPVLHFLRFERQHLGALIDDINATGYGLTLGIASRIGSTINTIIGSARVGNIYVNRNMIGAVVGVQPFGGQGLSGTGPKAGGPLYLHSLLARSPGPRWHWDHGGRASGALDELIAWLQQDTGTLRAFERERLRLQARSYADRSLLGARLRLCGYAGESNELCLHARGTLRATARSSSALLDQLAAALATGNSLSVDNAALADTLAAALPPTLRRYLHASVGGCCQAVLVDASEALADASWLRRLRAEVASTDGAIVPVIVASASDGYVLQRLLVEQTVTVNTAAVGGDARLLGLQDDAAG